MKLDSETRQRHLKETALRLQDEGYTVEWQENARLIVAHENGMLCTVENPGGISYRQEDMANPLIEATKDKAYDIVRQVAEYMRNMDRAPILKVPGVKDQYKLLAEFNGTVLAGMATKYGVNFVTWDRDFNYEGLSHGHYYANNYEGAKKDFATRSGLIASNQLFETNQLVEIYRCCEDTLAGDYELTNEQEKVIQSIKTQVEDAVPDIHSKISAQNKANELQMNM